MRSVNQGINRVHLEEGPQARVTRHTDVGYADGNAGENSLPGRGGKGGMGRLGVVSFSDAASIGIVHGVEGGISQ